MKTTILTHADCDGLCAGAIALAKFPDADVFFTKPVSFLYDFRDTKAERIVICDIALTKSHAKSAAPMPPRMPAGVQHAAAAVIDPWSAID